MADNRSKFELVVVRPIEGKTGELVAGRTVYADTITEAVKRVRGEFEGSGFVVLQKSQFKTDETDTTMTARLVEAYSKVS